MRATWLWGALLLAAAPAFGQPANPNETAAAELKQICAQVPCRKITTTLSLRQADGRVGQIDTELFPYLAPAGYLIIYPGETITLALAKDGSGKPRLLKVIDASGRHEFAKPAATDATLEFRFRQLEGKPDMMLDVQNATSATIKYDATQFVGEPRGVRPSPTSSCPVFAPGKGQATFAGLEHWPYPIVDLLIQNIRPLTGSADRACK